MSRLNQVDTAVLQRYVDSGERLAYWNYLKGTGPATTPARDARSGNVLGLVEDVAARSPALGAVVSVIADIGENAFLDMLMGASQGRSMLDTTTDANFAARAQALFAALSPERLITENWLHDRAVNDALCNVGACA